MRAPNSEKQRAPVNYENPRWKIITKGRLAILAAFFAYSLSAENFSAVGKKFRSDGKKPHISVSDNCVELHKGSDEPYIWILKHIADKKRPAIKTMLKCTNSASHTEKLLGLDATGDIVAETNIGE